MCKGAPAAAVTRKADNADLLMDTQEGEDGEQQEAVSDGEAKSAEFDCINQTSVTELIAAVAPEKDNKEVLAVDHSELSLGMPSQQPALIVDGVRHR